MPYMPPVFDIYSKHADLLTENVVIRLHGPDRGGMEERTGKDWSKIVEPRDADLDGVAGMLKDAAVRRLTAAVYPLTRGDGDNGGDRRLHASSPAHAMETAVPAVRCHVSPLLSLMRYAQRLPGWSLASHLTERRQGLTAVLG